MRYIESKVVVLGSKGVGKTSLINKYVNCEKYKSSNSVESTEAAACFTRTILVQDDCKVKLQIWDTAGQERFRAMGPMHYRNANAAILVFDLGEYRTFEDLRNWLQELHRHIQDAFVLSIVGNKLDQKRIVTYEKAHSYATSLSASYFETSIKDDYQGLDDVFRSTALRLVHLANEGKCRTLRQFSPSQTIIRYSNNNTAYSQMLETINCTYRRSDSNRHQSDEKTCNLSDINNPNDDKQPNDHGEIVEDSIIRLSSIPVGLAVEDNDSVKCNAEGRLEIISRSIDNIAWGEEVHKVRCC